VNPAGSGPNGGDRIRRCQAEVVVPVEVNRDRGPDELAGVLDQFADGLRPRHADRVDDDDLRGAGLRGCSVRRVVEVRLRARGVDAEVAHANPALHGVRDRRADALEHGLARDAERLQLQIGDRRLDHARLHAELHERLHVRAHGAREAPDLGRQAGARDQLDGAVVVFGHPREPRLDPLDAGVREGARDLELVVGRQDDTDRLLPVAERRVVEADLSVDLVRSVEASGPDHRTTPSGKGDSFSAPEAVIKKLSSSLRPPPPSQ
jgi:hypothetical protein